MPVELVFQHTATRRWLPGSAKYSSSSVCFNTQPPEGGCVCPGCLCYRLNGFNTQPPEGGCLRKPANSVPTTACFNTQPPEGGCYRNWIGAAIISVSTHSHPKVAAWAYPAVPWVRLVSTHSHPKVAAFLGGQTFSPYLVSTHSHPKVAAASLKSLDPSGFEAPISLSSQEKREREYNTAFSVIPSFTIS